MTLKRELLDQIEEWRKQQDNIEDMIQEAHNWIDFLDQSDEIAS